MRQVTSKIKAEGGQSFSTGQSAESDLVMSMSVSPTHDNVLSPSVHLC